MMSFRMMSHCMTSPFGVHSLLGLCEKNLFYNHANFQQVPFHGSLGFGQLLVIFA